MMKKFTLSLLLCTLCALVGNAAGSGIYLVGGFSSWQFTAENEFVASSEVGVYTLENVTLSGSFKIADKTWSVYNYGTNGTVPAIGTTYSMTAGGNNIDLGEKTYNCTKITLKLTSDTEASILIEGTEQVAGEITEVYVIGNNNGWNFNDASGKLSKTDVANEFKGSVTMVDSGDGFCYWRIYERLGSVGSWGFDANTTVSTLEGTFTKGKEGCCTTAAGTYDVTFNLSTGAFKLVENTGSVAGLNADAVKVIGGRGEITVIGTDNVAVYTAGGALVSRQANAKVQPGMYIVRAAGKVSKVIVK